MKEEKPGGEGRAKEEGRRRRGVWDLLGGRREETLSPGGKGEELENRENIYHVSSIFFSPFQTLYYQLFSHFLFLTSCVYNLVIMLALEMANCHHKGSSNRKGSLDSFPH